MSKRPAEDAETEEAVKKPHFEGGNRETMAEGGGAGNDKAIEGRNQRIFHPSKPLKLENKTHHTFTKSFYFKIYANDWQRFFNGTNTVGVAGFMTIIPYQALCMYISPNEYVELIRNSSYCKIKDSDFELEFKAVRTPFDANSTDLAEANGNLQFEIQRWDGLETMLPFSTVDIPYGADAPVFNTSYAELIGRLYGSKSMYLSTATDPWPATMRERGLSWRPYWDFNQNTAPTAYGTMYQTVNTFISTLPIGEFVTERLNTNQCKMGEGYCFSKQYKPKNGLITMASSAYSKPGPLAAIGSRTLINQKIRMHDWVPYTDPVTRGSPQYQALYPQDYTVSGEVTKTTDFFTKNIQHEEEDIAIPIDTTQAVSAYGPALAPNYRTAPCALTANEPPVDVGPYFSNATNPFGVWKADTLHQIDKVTKNLTTEGANALIDVAFDNVQLGVTNDNFQFGYNNDMAYYTVANLENYNLFTSRNDPPIHHMPSMMLGAIPKTTKQGDTIVNATLEFECRTRITVECSQAHPTYMNLAYAPVAEQGYSVGYMDPHVAGLANPADVVFKTRWQHNEKDVGLADNNKYWNHSYGLAGKPLFNYLPFDTPMLAKKK